MSTYNFPIASHSYFRIVNHSAERDIFLASDTYQPRFRYGVGFDEAVVSERMNSLGNDDPARQSLDLVLAALRLQDDSDAQAYDAFRSQNQALFGVPNEAHMTAILQRFYQLVDADTDGEWRYIDQALHPELDSVATVGPTPAIFNRYKEYFETYTKGALTGADLRGVLNHCLSVSGLSDSGWALHLTEDGSPARTNHALKIITVGRQYAPRMRHGAVRIAAHEVYGHALRGWQESVAEGEGFAVLLEQLLSDSFSFRRSYRYLAAGLGWGSYGTAMTFREVFDIIWRTMVIVSRYKPDVAQRHAFDECARVFRGGRPDVAGAVYLKDSIYFTANVAMWDELTVRDVRYNDFIDLIEGRQKILT